jgi:hypothetical protein
MHAKEMAGRLMDWPMRHPAAQPIERLVSRLGNRPRSRSVARPVDRPVNWVVAAAVLAAVGVGLGLLWRSGSRAAAPPVVRCPIHGIAYDADLEICPDCARTREAPRGFTP